MFLTSLLLALREIRRHLLRSFLTTLGIIIGVSAVITMVTLGNGVTASIKEQISSLGSNVFIVFPQSSDRGGPRSFKQADVDAIREQLAGVTAVAGQVSQTAEAIHNGQHYTSSVQGVSNAFMDARGIEIDAGRRFTSAEEQSGANACIIGPTLLEEIFVPGVSPLGEEMRLGDISCRVIGTYKSQSQGVGGQDSDNSALMPLKNVQRRFLGSDAISQIVISYDADYDSDQMQRALIALLRERRLLQSGQSNDFTVVDTAELNDTISSVVGQLTMGVAAIAGISLLVGGVGIMNIMLVSVTERTHEIGIRMAIGARAREVRMQFLTEAVVLCCCGGLVGIVLALGLSLLVARLAGLPFVFTPYINFVSFAISALIGIVFGYFPARRAASLDPIEALRHE